MKKISLLILLLTLLSCSDGDFEPEIKGLRLYTNPHFLYLNLNGREKTIELTTDESIGFRYPQWTKQDQILLTQATKTKSCYDFQIVSVDTIGSVLDTIYTPPSSTALNFRLAPNDSLMLLKTYIYECDYSDNYCYTFYNRFTKTSLPDTIRVESSAGIALYENVWSPDSKKVIIQGWSGGLVSAYAYNLETKDTIYIDKGSHFTWSPIDNDLVAYIKEYSLYSKNIKTGEVELIYEGKKKKSVVDFRWNPKGEFLMIHIKSYLLNIEAGPLTKGNVIYLSMPDKKESESHFENERIDTWKEITVR